MRLIRKREEIEIERWKKERDFFTRGYKAMCHCLNYENALGLVMKYANIEKVEIPDDRMYGEIVSIDVERTQNNTTIIKLLKEE